MGLLEELGYAVDNDYDYHEGVVSNTTLIKPLQMQILYKRYKGALNDSGNKDKRRAGTIMHKGYEFYRSGDENILQEIRLFSEINGKKISGKFDEYHKITGVVGDFKTTGTFTYVKKKYADYIMQLNINNMLLHDNGYKTCDKGEIILCMLDWVEYKVGVEEGYPESMFMVVPFDLMSPLGTRAYLEQKMSLEAKSEGLNDSELPECTDEELWKDPDTYSVKWFTKAGAEAKYPKKFDTHKEALEFSVQVNLSNPPELVSPILIQSEAKRCKYCAASDYCEQYKRMNPDEEW